MHVHSASHKKLQVCLFFNLYAAVAFFVLEVYVLQYKLRTYEMGIFSSVLSPMTFSVWALSEIFRLWFGYVGNLQEKLPQLSVFALLSFFPQLPCLVYLTYLQEIGLPFEAVMGTCLIIITCAELSFSYFSLQGFVQKQTQTYFRLMDDDYFEPIGTY